MESPALGGPSRETGLPPGVEVGPLGKRFVAYLVDSLVPGLAGGLVGALLPGSSEGTRLILGIAAGAVTLGWAVLVWFLLAVRAATPGMRLMKLQLVGFLDGRPIGWGRVFLRAVVFWLLTLTSIGLLIMLVLLVLHPRKQGWHDRAVNAVVIKERVLAPPKVVSATQPQLGSPPPSAMPVGSSPIYGPQPTYASSQSAPPLAGPPPAPAQPLTPPPGMGGYTAPGSNPYAAGHSPPPPSYPVPAPPPAYAPPAPPPGGQPTESGWFAVLDDGRRVTVDGLVLIGRNPQPEPGEEDAYLVKLADETRTVSKSHLAIALDPNGLYVVDRGSTNGSTVTTPAGRSTRCRPHEVVYVGAGSIVSIGDHWLEIRRTTGVSSTGVRATPDGR